MSAFDALAQAARIIDAELNRAMIESLVGLAEASDDLAATLSMYPELRAKVAAVGIEAANAAAALT